MKQIINVDASSLSDAGCMLRWHRSVVGGYRERVQGASLIYGKAFHKFQETMFRTKGDLQEAKKAMVLSFDVPKAATGKTNGYLADRNHVFATSYMYWEDITCKDTEFDLLMLPNGSPAVEQTFSFKYYEDDNVIVNLCGTIDRIGQIKKGCWCVRDYKTTSRWNPVEYLSEYRMSKQLRFYILALKIMSERYPDSVLGQIGATKVGARIDAVFLKERPTDNKYISSDVFLFSEGAIEEFRGLLDQYIIRLTGAVQVALLQPLPREGIINGSCDSKFRCKFWGVCSAPMEVQDTILERDFIQTPYNPLGFSD